MIARNARMPEVSQPAREEAIRGVVDDAHLNLTAEALADFLLEARRTIAPSSTPVARRRGQSHPAGGSATTRPYLRPVERLVGGGAMHAPTLSARRRQALLIYIEEVAARPRGAGLPHAEAA